MKTFTFKSSSGTAEYTTQLHDDGTASCNCRGWTFQRNGKPRECKHTKQVLAGRGVSPIQGFTQGQSLHQKRAAAKTVTALRTPDPMLASAMTERLTGAAFDKAFATGWWLEEKLDGHRVTAVVAGGVKAAKKLGGGNVLTVSAFSRPRAGGNGALTRQLPLHIVTALRTLGPGTYDGELVVPGGKSWDVPSHTDKLVLVLFDVLAVDGVDITGHTLTDRRLALLRCLARLPKQQTAVSTVEWINPSWEAVEDIWQAGGEGAILKRASSTYRPGARSPDWIKVKEIHAATLTIIGYESGLSGEYSALKLYEDKSGITTTVKTLGNAMLRDISRTPASYIGRRVVISYQSRTPSGTFRHGQFDHFAGDGE